MLPTLSGWLSYLGVLFISLGNQLTQIGTGSIVAHKYFFCYQRKVSTIQPVSEKPIEMSEKLAL